VDPANFNLAFLFDSDSSWQYSYELTVTGIPDGGFITYDDVEAAEAPEPSLFLPLLLAALVMSVRAWKSSQWGRL